MWQHHNCVSCFQLFMVCGSLELSFNRTITILRWTLLYIYNISISITFLN